MTVLIDYIRGLCIILFVNYVAFQLNYKRLLLLFHVTTYKGTCMKGWWKLILTGEGGSRISKMGEF